MGGTWSGDATKGKDYGLYADNQVMTTTFTFMLVASMHFVLECPRFRSPSLLAMRRLRLEHLLSARRSQSGWLRAQLKALPPKTTSMTQARETDNLQWRHHLANRARKVTPSCRRCWLMRRNATVRDVTPGSFMFSHESAKGVSFCFRPRPYAARTCSGAKRRRHIDERVGRWRHEAECVNSLTYEYSSRWVELGISPVYFYLSKQHFRCDF